MNAKNSSKGTADAKGTDKKGVEAIAVRATSHRKAGARGPHAAPWQPAKLLLLRVKHAEM